MTSKSEQGNREFRGEHEFRVGELSPPIRIRMYRSVEDGTYVIEQSHFIKTSLQYLPYAVDQSPAADEAKALDNLRQSVLHFYDQAVRRGYKPSNNWLVPNPRF